MAPRSTRRRARREQQRTRADLAPPPTHPVGAEQRQTIPPGRLLDWARSGRRSFLGGAILAFEGYRVQPETSGDFHGEIPATRSPEGEPHRLCFRPGRKRQAYWMPLGRSDGRLANGVFESSLLGVTHAQDWAASRGDVLRADVGLERVCTTRIDWHNLIYGLIFIVRTNCKVHTKAMRTVVSPGGCEIQSKIICRAGPPIKPRVQRQPFETAVEDQVVLCLDVRPFDNSPALQVLPDMRGLLDSAQIDEALEVGLNRGQRKRTRVCCDEAPNTVGCVVVALGAQEIYVARLAH